MYLLEIERILVQPKFCPSKIFFQQRMELDFHCSGNDFDHWENGQDWILQGFPKVLKERKKRSRSRSYYSKHTQHPSTHFLNLWFEKHSLKKNVISGTNFNIYILKFPAWHHKNDKIEMFEL